MSYAAYHARCWAQDRSLDEITREIQRCEHRYLQPYPWNGTECAEHTLTRIATLEQIRNQILEALNGHRRTSHPSPEH